MPWSVKKGAGCPPGKPWAVVVDATGKKVGCHATAEDAGKQIAALNANARAAVSKMEYRSVPAHQVRVTEDKESGEHFFEARILNYGVVDSYRTSWAPGVFAESLKTRMPTVLIHHNWNVPVAKVISYQDGPDGLDIRGKFGNFEHNPDARKAYGYMVDELLTEFSVGFAKEVTEPDEVNTGATRIKSAYLGEVSLVLEGAVPGTALLGVRTAAVDVDEDPAATILRRLDAGEIDLAAALEELANPTPTPDPVAEATATYEAAKAELIKLGVKVEDIPPLVESNDDETDTEIEEEIATLDELMSEDEL